MFTTSQICIFCSKSRISDQLKEDKNSLSENQRPVLIKIESPELIWKQRQKEFFDIKSVKITKNSKFQSQMKVKKVF